ncbi:serine/threonine-protein kinase [Vitiosangium sp. GDMCC 1.1324]|uniref:serine/threonine protein kinase n=1 Tax=Vitiosangium sp. (strain GDMCC 1.1324) TaxID=2138576 RepID=UPI000D3BFDB5|nr:serine/threonine-protein kinase [Vitiosangium sp. GDMCC 1.1324]PTL80958.1 serine/threonine protein kinase [Vitiosangium sp. GDMCC 1.1324]
MSSAYRLTGRVEAGELAELYEAVQEPTGTKVVIKLFHPKTSDPRYATVLAQTYSILNPLHPEGVVHVLDVGFVKNRLAVVREAVDGYTLGTALQRLNSKEVILPAPVGLFLVIQLLESVERAHAVGVVHGSITPGNVLLSRAGLPAVCDFGSLQALMGVPELKRAFVGRGRSAYRAPEVGRGDMPDVQSDIYSIGAMAYELLTLREAVLPEGGGVSTRRSAGLPPPSRLDRRIHARLDPIILRALEAMPSRRFRSCAELAGALRNFLSTNGGLPGTEDSRRFVAELFPNEVSIGLGPVPFSERFTLTPISGVSLAQVSADSLDKSVVVRPSFSPALNEADTMEAPPAFEDYVPEPTVAPGPMLDRAALDSTHVFSGASEKEKEPLEATHVGAKEATEATRAGAGEGTEATHVRSKEVTEPLQSSPPGDDEQTWVAPPGAPPPKPRRGPIVGGAAAEGTRVGKHPRLRMVEDFSRPAPQPESQFPAGGDAEDHIDTEKIEGTVIRSRVSEGTVARARIPEGTVTRARVPEGTVTRARVPEGTVTRARAPEGTVTRARVPPSLVRGHASEQPPSSEPDRSYIPMPPPTSPEVKAAVNQRRMFTEERNLLADSQRRRRMLGVTGLIALVGVVCFALGVWKLTQRPQLETDPKVSAVSGAVEEYLQQPAAPPPEPPKPKPAPPPEPVIVPPPSQADDAHKSGTAYLSIGANRPARAYIDGVRVKRNLPLVRYPVKSGNHEIIVETLGVPRQRDVFQLRLERGEHKKLEQFFKDSPHR